MMTNDALLTKLLALDYKEMSAREYYILAKYNEVFGLGKRYQELAERYLRKESEETKDKLIEIIEDKMPARFFILNRLDNYAIQEHDCWIDFKEGFYKNLSSLDNLRLCYLIDRIGRLSEKYHINFFGHRSNEPIAYYKFNEIIKKAYNLDLTFAFFGRGNPKKFQYLNFDKLDRDLFISRIKDYCKLYFPILEGISDVLSHTKDEELDSRKTVLAMNKLLDQYFQVIKREHNVLSSGIKERGKTWKYLVEGIESEDIDLEDID